MFSQPYISLFHLLVNGFSVIYVGLQQTTLTANAYFKSLFLGIELGRLYSTTYIYNFWLQLKGNVHYCGAINTGSSCNNNIIRIIRKIKGDKGDKGSEINIGSHDAIAFIL